MNHAKNHKNDVTPAENPTEPEQNPRTEYNREACEPSWRLGSGGIRPPTPLIWRRRRGRRSFGVDKPKNCSGYCRGATGFPGIHRVSGSSSQALRDYPKNCSGYYTRELTPRQLLTRRPAVFCLGQQPEQLFALFTEPGSCR